MCIPILSWSWWSGRWRTRKKNMWLRSSKAMLAISPACLLPFNLGHPLTTTYASPTVSTWKERYCHKGSCRTNWSSDLARGRPRQLWQNCDKRVLIMEKIVRFSLCSALLRKRITSFFTQQPRPNFTISIYNWNFRLQQFARWIWPMSLVMVWFTRRPGADKSFVPHQALTWLWRARASPAL